MPTRDLGNLLLCRRFNAVLDHGRTAWGAPHKERFVRGRSTEMELET